MNVGVLCNSRLCIPSLQVLVQLRHKVSIVLPEKRVDDHFEIEQFAHHFGLSLSKFKKEELDQELVDWKKQHNITVIFIITFPYILSSRLLDAINIDILNFHFAPLPKYRGAQPTFWLIKNGEKKGGISVHVVTKKIDGGQLLHAEPYQLSDFETHNSYLNNVAVLNTKVIRLIAEKINLQSWKNGLKKQFNSDAKYYPKPKLEDITINWQTMTAIEIERLCRACNPWNKGAMTVFNRVGIKLVELTVLPYTGKNEAPGTLVCIKETQRLAVSSKDNKYLDINIAYEEQMGYFSNSRLSELGLKEGVLFQ